MHKIVSNFKDVLKKLCVLIIVRFNMFTVLNLHQLSFDSLAIVYDMVSGLYNTVLKIHIFKLKQQFLVNSNHDLLFFYNI